MAKPILQALLIADHIYEDKGSGKRIIAGIFQKVLRVRKEQRERLVTDSNEGEQLLVVGGLQAGSPYAYVSVTEVRGRKTFILRYVRLHDDQALFQTEFQIHCDDPLITCEVVLPLPMLPTQESGVFALELLCDSEPLGTYRITVADFDGGIKNGNT